MGNIFVVAACTLLHKWMWLIYSWGKFSCTGLNLWKVCPWKITYYTVLWTRLQFYLSWSEYYTIAIIVRAHLGLGSCELCLRSENLSRARNPTCAWRGDSILAKSGMRMSGLLSCDSREDCVERNICKSTAVPWPNFSNWTGHARFKKPFLWNWIQQWPLTPDEWTPQIVKLNESALRTLHFNQRSVCVSVAETKLQSVLYGWVQ